MSEKGGDVISEGTWYDHHTDTGGHTTSGGHVSGVTPWRYTDCIEYGCEPVVVLNPKSTEQAVRLDKEIRNAYSKAGVFDVNPAKHMRAALTAMVEPEWREVYAHQVASSSGDVHRSLCGKIWTSDPKTRVVGHCPACIDLTEQRWTA